MHINKKPFLDVISTVILHYIRNYSGIFKLGSGPIPMYPVMSTFTIFAMNSKYKFAIELLGCIVDLTRQSKNNLEYWSHCLTNDNIFILYKSLATIGYCAQLPISGEVAIDYPVCLRSALQLRMLRRGYSRCVDNELLESEEGKAITTLLIPVMNQLLKDKNYKELAALFELITQSEMYAYIQDKVAVADEFFSVFNALAPKKPDMSKVSDHIKLLIDDLTRMDFDTLESACKILHVLVNNLTQSHIVTTVYRQEIKKIITQLEMFSAHLLRQCMSEIEFKFEAYKANEEISDNDMCVRPVININLENNFETLDQVLRISQLLVTLSLERDRTQYNKMLRFAEEAHETAIQVYEKAQLINADKRYTLSLSEETTRKVFNLDDRTAVKSQQEWIISYLDSQKVLCKEYLQTHTKQKRKDTKQHSSPPARKVMGSAAESSNPQLSHHDFFKKSPQPSEDPPAEKDDTLQIADFLSDEFNANYQQITRLLAEKKFPEADRRVKTLHEEAKRTNAFVQEILLFSLQLDIARAKYTTARNEIKGHSPSLLAKKAALDFNCHQSISKMLTSISAYLDNLQKSYDDCPAAYIKALLDRITIDIATFNDLDREILTRLETVLNQLTAHKKLKIDSGEWVKNQTSNIPKRALIYAAGQSS